MASSAKPDDVCEKDLGHGAATEKAPGHWVLARLGKRVLRPGGIPLTRRLLDALAIGSSDDVVEFAPGLGATARLTLAQGPASYTAVERDESAAQLVRRYLTPPQQQCIVGRAEATGLPDACANVVYGEAMLTMQSVRNKARIVGEAARLLRPGGRYGIHEIVLVPQALGEALSSEIRTELTQAVHHTVAPITVTDWRDLFQSSGLTVTVEATAPMHLLEPRRLVQDEGFAGAARFAWNVLRDADGRRRVLAMRRVFRKYATHIAAIMLVGVKENRTDS